MPIVGSVPSSEVKAREFRFDSTMILIFPLDGQTVVDAAAPFVVTKQQQFHCSEYKQDNNDRSTGSRYFISSIATKPCDCYLQY
jgi:hypothetical protein